MLKNTSVSVEKTGTISITWVFLQKVFLKFSTWKGLFRILYWCLNPNKLCFILIITKQFINVVFMLLYLQIKAVWNYQKNTNINKTSAVSGLKVLSGMWWDRWDSDKPTPAVNCLSHIPSRASHYPLRVEL